MNAATRFNTALCRTALLAMLAYCLGETPPRIGLALLASTLVLVAWLGGRSGRPATLPRVWVNLLVLGVMVRAGAGVIGAGGQPLVSELAELLVLILTIKLFDRRTPRDEAQALTMSIFLAIGAVLTSVSILVGTLLLVFCVSAVLATMLFHIHAGAVRAREAAGAAEQRESAPSVRSRTPTAHFRRVAGTAIAGVFVLSTAAFILTPRGMFQNVLGRFGQVAGTQIGYSDEVSLGVTGAGRLGEGSTRPVMDVEVLDEQGRNIGSPFRSWRLRGSTGNAYIQGRWSQAEPSDPRSERVGPSALTELGERGNGGYRDLRFTVHRDARRLPVFAPWRPIALLTGENAEVDVLDDLTMRRTKGQEVRDYTVRVSLALGVPTTPSGYTQEFSEPIVELAREILDEAGVPFFAFDRTEQQNRLAARAIERYLQRTYQYTLDLNAPRDGEDPIEMFLFRTRQGHCEYFASAMTALCHSASIPARVVAGYLASEFSRSSGRYIVRESQAHAWVEVELAPGQWTSFDPSPAAEVAALHQPELGLFGRLRRWYEAIELRWAVSVIGFDRDRQAELFGMAQANKPGEDSGLVGVYRRLRDRLSGGDGTGGVSGLALARAIATLILVVIGLGLLVRLIRRRLALRRPRSRSGVPRGAEFYGRLLRVLDKADIPKPEDSPILSHVRRNAPRLGGQARVAEDLAALYYRARFGGRPVTDAERARAQEQVRELEAALGSGR